MKNWCYKVTEGEHIGKTIWSGRYCAIAAFIFCRIDGIWCVLANKRGIGTPDFQGLWNCPCGFLEADESAEQGCSRETYEETGVKVNSSKFKFVGVETDPATCNNGNVTLRYCSVLEQGREDISVSKSAVLNSGGEKDEVDTISWIPLNKIDAYQWAFNHRQRIAEIISWHNVQSVQTEPLHKLIIS